MNKTQEASSTGRKAPQTPITAQAIVAAIGIERKRWLANSARWSSSDRGSVSVISTSGRRARGGVPHANHRILQAGFHDGIAQRPQARKRAQRNPTPEQLGHRVIEDFHMDGQ